MLKQRPDDLNPLQPHRKITGFLELMELSPLGMKMDRIAELIPEKDRPTGAERMAFYLSQMGFWSKLSGAGKDSHALHQAVEERYGREALDADAKAINGWLRGIGRHEKVTADQLVRMLSCDLSKRIKP